MAAYDYLSSYMSRTVKGIERAWLVHSLLCMDPDTSMGCVLERLPQEMDFCQLVFIYPCGAMAGSPSPEV